jgi:hypothetical protein
VNNWIAEESAGITGVVSCHGLIARNLIVSSGSNLISCSGVIENNLMVDSEGTGLLRCSGLIRNNTVHGNAGTGLQECVGEIVNCIVWGNGTQIAESSTPEHSCIQDWTGGGVGNISEAPQFVDSARGDFHQMPSSPCIDAGASVEVAVDFDGDARPFDGTDEARGDGSDFDMGADEFVEIRAPHVLAHILGVIRLTGEDFDAGDVVRLGE